MVDIRRTIVSCCATAALAAACTSSSRAPAASAPSATTHPVVAACLAANLRVHLSGVVKFTRPAGLAHEEEVASFAVTNHGTTCELRGYVKPLVPASRLRLGGMLPTGNDRPTRLVVPPGKSVNFSVDFIAARDSNCSTPTVLRTLVFSDGLRWTTHAQGLSVCSSGVVRVGPLHTPVY